jgi:hydroxyethylthiazole kinase-like sugar kinase family protein
MSWFVVELDTAYEPAPGMAVFEIVEDAVRGGDVVESQAGHAMMTSVVGTGEDAEMLCAACTTLEDAKGN